MRYLLDTCIIVFLLNGLKLSKQVSDKLDEFDSKLYVSSETIRELAILSKKGKLGNCYLSDLILDILFMNIEIISVTTDDLLRYDDLKVNSNHKDPVDHIIISQAINNNLTLVSSDTKFDQYRSQGLKLLFNKR